MSLLWRLSWANLRVRRTRMALTAAAIALSVSLVVAVTSGYATTEAAAMRMLGTFLGTVDARIVRGGDAFAGVPASVVDDLRRDPDVALAVGRIEMQASLIDHAGRPVEGRSILAIGLQRPEDDRVEALELIEGDWFDTAEGDVVVIDQVTAALLKDPWNYTADESRGRAKVGEWMELPAPHGNLKLRIVGVVHKPKILAMLQPSVYVPVRTLQRWSADGGAPVDRVSSVQIDLAPSAEPVPFAERWRARLADVDPLLKLTLTSEQRSELDRNLMGVRLASFLGGAIALLAATFIILSALSMGVNERQRTLAMMRAIGADKWQLGGLVVVESLLLAAMGIAVGVPLGLLWVKVLHWMFSDLLQAGIVVSFGGMAFAVGGSLAAALAASILPAVGATRTDPLEAMTPLARPGSVRRAMLLAIPGALFAGLDSAIIFTNWRPLVAAFGLTDVDLWARTVQFYLHFSVGLPALMLGFFLMAPLFVVVVERLAGPLVAAAGGLRFSLLRQQLSGGVWRAAGTAAALMVGLAILVVLQVQGNTVVGGWRLPDKFPDIFITTFKLGGLTPADVAKIRTVEGIRKDELLPIAIASPEFGSTIFSIRGAAAMPDATMFFGVDPRLALNMMQLDFRDGTPERAADLMTAHRRHVLVTEEFRKLKGLGVGDRIALKTPLHGVVDYTIAGVVWSPGLDVVVSMFDLGKQFEQRTAASIFGTLEDARDDFGVENIYLFAANLEPGIQKEALSAQVQQKLGAWGVQAGDVRQIKYYIQHHFKKILLMISTVAFSAMAVAALGVANTVMAGVRSRRWQFGIMRSIGVTRGQLLRLVLAEALLLGLVGVALGLGAGTLLAVNAKQLLLVMVGYDPPFTIPWDMIGIGVLAVLSISLLAGLWPAVSVARSEPLSLLQAGRASG